MKRFSEHMVLAAFFTALIMAWLNSAQSAGEPIKLPYAKGESFVVTQGYDSPPTHIGKDEYAIDFTQSGCSAYGKAAVAAVSGKVWVVNEAGYSGGYGTELLIRDDDNEVSRYAHLIPGSVPFQVGDSVMQGMAVGSIGDTGLVTGTACGAHPGAHIHFAMDRVNADGSLVAKNPEPISGYVNITEGKWYVSDNDAATTENGKSLTAIAGEQMSVPGNSGDLQGSPGANPTDVSGNRVSASATASVSSAVQSSSGQGAKDSELPDVLVNAGAALTSSESIYGNSFQSSSAITSGSSSLNSIEATSSASSSGGSSGGGMFSGGTATFPPAGGVSVVVSPQPSGGQSSAEADAIAPASTASTTFTASSTPPASTTVTTPPADTASTTSSADTTSPASTTVTTSTAATSSISFALQSPSASSNAASLAEFDSSTLAIDFSWQAPSNASGAGPVVYNIFSVDTTNSSSVLYATTTNTSFTYPIADAEFGTDKSFGVQAVDGAGDESALVTTTVALPDWFSTIQSYDGNDSRPSWYDDNWYDLGTGFFGTLRSLNLEGYINSDSFASSSLTLQEFSDPDYTALDHVFPISDDAPFKEVTAKVTIPNLKIPLETDKYYRLTTLQDFQNRSVVLKGTETTGTAMWDNFVYGQGGVQYEYPFYPYLSGVIEPEELPLAPPVIPENISTSFNAPISRLKFSWQAATDADAPFNGASYYEINISTSASLDPGAWSSVGGNLSSTFTAVFPHAYLIGVRAVDAFGNPSAPVTLQWNFPSDYAPPPSQLDHSAVVANGTLSGEIKAQKVTFTATTTARSVDFWMAPVQADYSYYSETQLAVYGDNGGARGDEIPSGNPKVDYGLFDGPSEGGFTFASPITFPPGSYWFVVSVGPRQWNNPTTIYGSPGGDAYYRFEQPTSL